MGAKRKIEIARSNEKYNDFITNNNNNDFSSVKERGIFHVQSRDTSQSSSSGIFGGMKDIHKCIGTNKKEHIPYDFRLVPRCLKSQNYIGKITEDNRLNKSLRGMNHAYAQVLEDSCLWSPPSREEWDRCADEMTALCNTAMYFRNKNQICFRLCCKKKGNQTCIHLCCKKKGPAENQTCIPLTYIRDRIDIDDPLSGYQIRHRKGGWLQGFVMITPFTTWTCYFKWDSLHVKSGMVHSHHNCPDYNWDSTGSFSAELEEQPRSGDPHKGGVVWSTIAEISIVGGLGCGELLVKLALDEARCKGYDYVVLQATETSRPFYEKLGFCRVGAVARYLRNKDKNTLRNVVGYRHWTYADEKNLEYHGRPSIMMAIRIDNSWPPLLDIFQNYFVDDKPKIHKLIQVDYTPPSKKLKLNFDKPHVVPASPNDYNTRSSPRNLKPIPSSITNPFEEFNSESTIPMNELKKQKITELKRDSSKPPFF